MLKLYDLKWLYLIKVDGNIKIFFFKNSFLKYLKGYAFILLKSSFKQEIFNRFEISNIERLETILGLHEKVSSKPNLLDEVYEEIEDHNRAYIEKELEDGKDVLDTIEANPLTNCQRKAVINSNKYTLVLAGAGSGKTSVIMAKVAYLVTVKKVNPKEILLLSYNKNAVEVLNRRIESRGFNLVEAITFHALGKKLRGIEENRSHESISNDEKDEKLKKSILHKIIKNNLSDFQFRQGIEFFVQFEHEDQEEENSRNTSIKKEFRSVNGVKLKSYGELIIANYLFFRGIKYEYEENLKKITQDELVTVEVQPDFYLPDYDVWIEHWGIDVNGKGPDDSNLSELSYVESMKLKKELYRKMGLKLVETTYGNLQNKQLEEKLEEQLISFEIDINGKQQFDSETLTDFMEDNPGPGNNLIKGFEYYSRELPERDAFKELFISSYGEKIADKITYVISKVYNDYKEYLGSQNLYTFDDMIQGGIKALDNNLKLKWKYVLVDEFQDISNMRFKLLKKLITKLDASLFCVGDDWQSINGFSGSNINYTLNFDKEFRYSERVDIGFTFRFRQDLVDVSRQIVLRDKKLINKKVRSAKSIDSSYLNDFTKSSVNIIDLRGHDSIYLHFARLLKNIPHINKKEILFLSRTNESIDFFKGNFASLYAFSETQSFKTIHRSKGLEADIVVIIDIDDQKCGLPSNYAENKFQSCLRLESQSLEERRLFYVALTRAKEKVYIVKSSNQFESAFLKELEGFEEYINYIDASKKSKKKFKPKVKGNLVCPSCREGRLVEKINRSNGTRFLGCNMFRKNNCRFTKSIDGEVA